LNALKGGDDKIAVLIAGDKETQYKNVIEVLDEVKRSGFQRVALETASK
jgi:biopolymer transport protein TolR